MNHVSFLPVILTILVLMNEYGTPNVLIISIYNQIYPLSLI